MTILHRRNIPTRHAFCEGNYPQLYGSVSGVVTGGDGAGITGKELSFREELRHGTELVVARGDQRVCRHPFQLGQASL